MSVARPHLSIIIISWNTCELLSGCLTSIYQHPSQASFEVLVVDNASTDASPTMVREYFPQVGLIENQINLGFGAANNQALTCSRGDLVLFLNSDASLQADNLQAMVDFMGEHLQAGGLGGMLINLDGSFQASFAHFPTLWSEFLLISGLASVLVGPYAPSPRPKKDEQPHPVDWVSGAALLVRKAALDQAGFFDERYFMYSEETDLCWRVWKSGWQVWYVPQIRLFHLGGGSSRKSSLQSYMRLYQSKIAFFDRNYGEVHGHRLKWMICLLLKARINLWKILNALRLKTIRGTDIQQRINFEQKLLESINQ